MSDKSGGSKWRSSSKQYMDAKLNRLPYIIITLITVALDSFGIHLFFCVLTTPNNYLNGSKL